MSKKELPAKPLRGTWVQTERAAHEAWASLIARSPIAARAMHIITSQIDDQNAFIISQEALAGLVSCSERRLRDALKILSEENWLEIRRIGGRGTVNAYVVNDRVAWTGSRDGLRYSLFSAKVFVPETEQPDRDELGSQPPLRRIPSMLQGEAQLPSGDGLPPVSQPALPGMEPELPALRISGAENSEREKFDARQSDQFENLTRQELLALARRSADNSRNDEFPARKIDSASEGEIDE